MNLALIILSGDIEGINLQASIRCLAKGGKLLEIGKYDMMMGTQLAMEPMLRNVEFAGIDLDDILVAGNTAEVSCSLNEVFR